MGFFDDFVAGITGIVTVPISSISTFFDGFDPLDVADDLAKAVISLGYNLYQSFLSFGSLISNAALEMASSILQTAETIVGAVILAGQNLVDGMVNGVLSIFSWLTDWTNTIYGGFQGAITDTVAEIEEHVQQFALGVVDKAELLGIVNAAMIVFKADITRPEFDPFHTAKRMLGASALSLVTTTLFKGLIP